MRFAIGICTLGLLSAVFSLLMMRGSLTRQAKMEACYELSGTSYSACLERNEQRSIKNSERINADYRRGARLFRVSLGLVALGVLLMVIVRLAKPS